MTIQSEERFMASLWDWGILKGCFGDSKIEPTDMDGLVERKGHFLVLEAKQPGVKIKQGQWWTFNALVNTGYFTIVILWGERNKPQEMQVLYPLPYKATPKRSADLRQLRKVVSWWYRYANSKKRIPLSSR
ncbi:MAG: hypothetical protein PHH26_03155 [Candidatus Thermoplasmatota archaeon]|nr:hypothetical protein [Candidatus Thermoplasmatota archaeon]